MGSYTDFTKGIITDIDPQDGSGVPNSVRDAVNKDLWPGHAEKRQGTQEKTYTLAGGGTIPSQYEKIIQVSTVHAPMAKAGSVKGFPSSEEHCLNTDVTVIMVHHVNLNAYRIYADIYAKDQFVVMSTPSATNEFRGVSGDIPFMVPRTGGVAIGGVTIFDSSGLFTTEKGVLWFGHIKKFVGWTKDGTGAYTYLDRVDEWRLSNAECYDSGGDIQCELLVSAYEQRMRAGTPIYSELDSYYASPMETIVDKVFRPWLISKKRNFKIKVTAMYDGYQESRPLRWRGELYRPVDVIHSVPAITTPIGDSQITVNGETRDLPTGWEITPDMKNNQYAQVTLDGQEQFCVIEAAIPLDGPVDPDSAGGTYDPNTGQWTNRYPRGRGFEDGPGSFRDKIMTLQLRLRWNNDYVEGGDIRQNGEGFRVYVHTQKGPNEVGAYGKGFYDWEFDSQGRRTALHVYPHFQGSRTWPYHITVELLLWLLGIDNWPMRQGHPNMYDDEWREVRKERDFVRSMFTVTDWWVETDAGFDSGHAGWPAPYDFNGVITFSSEQIVQEWRNGGALVDTDGTYEFGLSDRVGLGMLAVCPVIPHAYFSGGGASSSGSIATTLLVGGRRLTGFRFYVKEDDVDIDYRLVREIDFDFNEADVDHGGFGDLPEEQFDNFRELDGGVTKCPTWMDDGTEIRPYFTDTYALNTETLNYNMAAVLTNRNLYLGLTYRGGMNRAFLISDEDMIDRAGTATLSGNLMRDERERDNPSWSRGAICEGRLFGISMEDGDMQYCIFASGVPQYDIMPDAFHVAKGETLTHIVSFRGQHHLIFTDQSLWRIDLADGDEFNWRVYDTYAKRGTTCWRAITHTPYGIVYPNDQGVWLYDGNRPQSLTRGKWQKHFLRHWATKTGHDVTYGGFNAGMDEVHLTLFSGDDPADDYADVWILDLTTMAWRKYRYMDMNGDYIRPQYMTWHGAEFLQSFDHGDFRKPTGALTDLGIPYPCLIETQELPPSDQTAINHFQYFGAKYQSPVDYPCRLYLTFAAYRHQIHAAKKILMPPLRREYFFPVPLGISRNMKAHFGQGTLVGDTTNSDEPVVLSGLSFRRYDRQQWSGTR